MLSTVMIKNGVNADVTNDTFFFTLYSEEFMIKTDEIRDYCDPHEWSFKDRDGYTFDWDTSSSKEFTVIEQCNTCRIEREATYRLIKINGEYE